jgi:hypothetical protein
MHHRLGNRPITHLWEICTADQLQVHVNWTDLRSQIKAMQKDNGLRIAEKLKMAT